RVILEQPDRRRMQHRGEKAHVVERVLRVLSRGPASGEERLQRLCRALDDALVLDASDPPPLQRMADGMEHAEPQGSVCTTTSATAGTARRTRASIALAWPCASAREPARARSNGTQT